MRLPQNLVGPIAFAIAALLCIAAASWAALIIETRSTKSVQGALEEAGHSWATVSSDGLQVILRGTAPTEAMRFRALSIAGETLDASRLHDRMKVTQAADIEAPDFSIEILRNDDGISLIGLAPASDGRDAIVRRLTAVTGEGMVTDMLETANHKQPRGWEEALAFGLDALEMLPRSKISITADRVAITAISDSAAERKRLEDTLRGRAPAGMALALDISAPRPVIAPFTLRFLIDEEGARFDACSADSERARNRILAAGTEVGVAEAPACTIGLGVPTPAWADAVTMGLHAMQELGAGSITYSDADISLIADEGVTQATFDRVVGELDSNLPEVFSLHAVLTPAANRDSDPELIQEFTATLSAEGALELRGRLSDELSRDAVESFAQARFGSAVVHTATRLDDTLPEGWPIRVLAALEALGELHSGSAVVLADTVRIEGVTGSLGAGDAVARILSAKLGDAREFELSIRYDKALDPLLSLPTPEKCAADINAALAANKIRFEPGSANIAEGGEALDAVAALMKNCSDFPMEVGGHTDSQGSEEMNLSLSETRAEAIIAELMARRTLTGNLAARGYGETVPIGDNETEVGRESNRRIEFRLIEAQDLVTGPDTEAEVLTPDDDTPRPKKRP